MYLSCANEVRGVNQLSKGLFVLATLVNLARVVEADAPKVDGLLCKVYCLFTLLPITSPE